jgi:hypothetical protein
MTDSTRTAREDLAFLRALTEDRGPLPWSAGAYSFAVGALFGLNLLAVWALRQSRVDLPLIWLWSWAPGTVVYLLAHLLIRRRGRGETIGPTLRMVGASWLAVHAMTLFIVLALMTAHAATGIAYEQIWPAIAWSLYGGAWTVAGLVRRDRWPFVIAAGSFAFALAGASQIAGNGLWLVLGLGAIWTFAVPGWLIMRQARRTR